jgi:hypothetical protein
MTKRVIIAGLLAGILAGCSERDSPASSSQPSAERRTTSPAPTQASGDAPAFDACKLLSNEEIQAVQGEPVKATTPHGESANGLAISQCFFELPTFSNSITLRVIERAAGQDGRDPREVWKQTFRPVEPTGGRKKLQPPQKVPGVGDDAYWISRRKAGGALWVLKGDHYIRLSVGGEDDLPTKITKCSKLSEFVLSRLPPEK